MSKVGLYNEYSLLGRIGSQMAIRPNGSGRTEYK